MSVYSTFNNNLIKKRTAPKSWSGNLVKGAGNRRMWAVQDPLVMTRLNPSVDIFRLRW